MNARYGPFFSPAAPPGRARLAAVLFGVVLLLWAAPCRAQSGTRPRAGRAAPVGTPTAEELFRVESERAFRERIRREARRDRDRTRVEFPPDSDLPEQPAMTRS